MRYPLSIASSSAQHAVSAPYLYLIHKLLGHLVRRVRSAQVLLLLLLHHRHLLLLLNHRHLLLLLLMLLLHLVHQLLLVLRLHLRDRLRVRVHAVRTSEVLLPVALLTLHLHVVRRVGRRRAAALLLLSGVLLLHLVLRGRARVLVLLRERERVLREQALRTTVRLLGRRVRRYRVRRTRHRRALVRVRLLDLRLLGLLRVLRRSGLRSRLRRWLLLRLLLLRLLLRLVLLLGRPPSLVPEVVRHVEHRPGLHLRHGWYLEAERGGPEIQGGVLLYLERALQPLRYEVLMFDLDVVEQRLVLRCENFR